MLLERAADIAESAAVSDDAAVESADDTDATPEIRDVILLERATDSEVSAATKLSSLAVIEFSSP